MRATERKNFMLKKIFICLLMSATIICAGCGEEKVVGTPDKAILAYAEIITTGESENLSAAGFSEEDNKNLRDVILKIFLKPFSDAVPLSDETMTELEKIFYANNKTKMTFQTKMKTDNKEHPVVELTTTPLDISNANKELQKNNELFALLGMVGKLKSDGITDDQLKQNPEVQKLAVTAFTKYIEGVPFQEEKTFEVPCKKVEGTDGNIHWAPADAKALTDFMTGGK